MNPLDVTRTRVYNQPRSINGEGLVYKNAVDAFGKIVVNEGVIALYKGFLPSFFRLGPHFTLTFLFYEQMKRISIHRASMTYLADQDSNLQKILDLYDANGNGRLEPNELVEILKQYIPKNSAFPSEEAYEAALKEEVWSLMGQYSESKAALGKSDLPQFLENAKGVAQKYKQ